MYYINRQASENGNHGTPRSNPTALTVALPDELISVYLGTMGFAHLTVEDGKVASVTVNQTALDAYTDAHPDVPEPPTEPTVREMLAALSSELTDTQMALCEVYELMGG